MTVRRAGGKRILVAGLLALCGRTAVAQDHTATLYQTRTYQGFGYYSKLLSTSTSKAAQFNINAVSGHVGGTATVTLQTPAEPFPVTQSPNSITLSVGQQPDRYTLSSPYTVTAAINAAYSGNSSVQPGVLITTNYFPSPGSSPGCDIASATVALNKSCTDTAMFGTEGFMFLDVLIDFQARPSQDYDPYTDDVYDVEYIFQLTPCSGAACTGGQPKLSISSSDSNLSFTVKAHDTSPSSQTIHVQNTGSVPLQWSAAPPPATWLSTDNNGASVTTQANSYSLLTVTVDPSKLDATPAGSPLTGTITVQSNGGTGVVNVSATVVPATDTAAFQSVSPAPGSSLTAAPVVPFQATVQYTLVTADSGQLTVRLSDDKGNAVSFSDDSGNPVAAPVYTVQKGSGSQPFSFDVGISPFSSSVTMQASLADSSGKVLATSPPAVYSVDPNSITGVAIGDTATLWAGNMGTVNDVLVTYTLTGQSPATITADLLKKTADNKLVGHEDGIIRMTVPPGIGQELTIPSLYRRIAPDADFLQYQLTMTTQDGRKYQALANRQFVARAVYQGCQDVAPTAAYPIEPDLGVAIEPSSSGNVELWCKVYVNAPDGGSLLLKGANLGGINSADLVDIPAGTSAIVPLDFKVTLPSNSSSSAIAFVLQSGNQQTATQGVTLYPDNTLALPAGAGTTAAPGVTITTTTNTAPRKEDVSVTMMRGIIQVTGFLVNAGQTSHPYYVRHGLAAPAASPAQGVMLANGVWTFSPAIPADGSFAGTLTLQYDPSILPDDPNFSEGSMQVVAIDPVARTGQMLPATIDPVGHTATVTVNSLSPSYALAMPGFYPLPSFGMPILSTLEGSTSGFSFVNFGANTTNLSLAQYDEGGNTAGPVAQAISSGQQFLNNSPGEFNIPQGNVQGWVQTRGDQPGVAGIELLTGTTALDALAMPTGYFAAQILTDVEYNATWTTEIHIANTTNFSGGVTVELHDPSGNTVGSYYAILGPKGKLAMRGQEMFPSLARPFVGYALIRADQVVAAAEVLAGKADIAVLGGQPLSAPGMGQTLYGAHFESGKGAMGARLTLVNPTAKNANISIQPFATNGAPLAPAKRYSLVAGGQTQTDVGALFGFSGSVLTTGSLAVQTDTPGVVGDVSFLDPAGVNSGRSSYALDGAPGQFEAFGLLAAGAGLFEGLAIQDASGGGGNVAVRAFRADGTPLGSTQFALPANGRFSDLLSNMIPATAAQQGGYFTVEAGQPVSATAVFGAPNLSAYSALPAIPLSGVGLGSITSDPPLKLAGNSLTGAAGVPPPLPAIAVAPSPVNFGSATVGQASAAVTVTIQNSGTGALSVTKISITGSQFAASGLPTLPLSLAAGATTSFQMTMTPPAAGPQTGTLTIASNDPNHPSVTVSLTGAGAASGSGSGTPGGLPSPLATNLVGLFLMNEGSGTTDQNLVGGKAAKFSGASPPTWNTADPSIVFSGGPYKNSYMTPDPDPPGTGATADPNFDKLTVSKMTIVAKVYVNSLGNAGICEKNDGNSIDSGFSFELNSDGSLHFVAERTATNLRADGASSVGSGKWVQVAVTWDGTASPIVAANAHLFVNGVEVTKPGGIDGGGTMGYANATNQPFRIGTATVDSAGSFNGKMAYLAVYRGRILTLSELTQLDSALPIKGGATNGSGGGGAAMSISPTSLAFDQIAAGSSQSKTLTISNTGSSSLTISSFTVSGGIAGTPPFAVSPSAPLTVPAGGQQAITVKFAPQSPGTYSGTLTIFGNDPKNPSQGVGLTGTGTPGSATGNLSLTFSPNPVSRGSDGNWTFTLTVRETGGVGVTLTKLLVGGQDYTSLISSFLGTNRVAANQTISTSVAGTGYTAPVSVVWQVTGNDDSGHSGLTWSGTVQLLP